MSPQDAGFFCGKKGVPRELNALLASLLVPPEEKRVRHF